MSDKKILVADYNTRELQHLKKIFTDEGFEVTTVMDGKAAIDAFFAEQPDVVLLSAMLSKINGFDVCRQIKDSDTGRNVPVVLATSVYKGQKYRLKAIHENKASEFVEKPVADEVLIETVRKFLGDTRSLVANRRSEIAEQAPRDWPAAAEPAPRPAPPPEPKPARPAAPPPGPSEKPAAPPPARKTKSEFEQLEEITSTLITSEAKQSAKESEDQMDQLLTDTLSGLGIDLDKGKEKKPAPAAATPKAPPPAPKKPVDEDKQAQQVLSKLFEESAAPAAKPAPPAKADTGEMKIARLEEDVLKDIRSQAPEQMVEKFLRSFDTDLEKKLSDTLSGVGLTDTNIEKVIEPAKRQPSKEEPPEEGTKFGDYILDKKIGHGGMAELWRAKKRGSEGFQKIVAIKRILPHLSDNQELVTMFIDEAKIAAQLSHQNVVNIFDFGKINNSFYIAMEYVDGFDLKKALSRAKELSIRFPHKLAAYVAMQIASALDYAHHKKDFESRDLNIVHRDVSPQNILISKEGEVKLVDFGISKAESKIHHTVKGALKGKLLYMSPEQAWGKPVDKRSDLFSLGIVLCEVVSGKVLFEDSSEFDVLEKVRSGKIPILENELAAVPPRLKAIIDKSLLIDITKRYQNAAELAKELHDYVHAGGPVPSPKDLRAYLTRLFPDYFGLKEGEVKNLTFDEFLEKEEPLPIGKLMSEETVLLESEEMAGLEEIRPETELTGGKDVELTSDEIIVESRVEPIKASAESAPAEVKPAPVQAPAPTKEKPIIIKKDKKKAPEPPPPVKKPEPVVEKPKPPVEKPKPGAEKPKPQPAAPEEEKKVLTKRLTEKKMPTGPLFGAVTEKKGANKMIFIAVGALVLIVLAVVLFFMVGSGEKPAPVPPPVTEETPAEPTAAEPPVTEPVAAASGKTAKPAPDVKTPPKPAAPTPDPKAAQAKPEPAKVTPPPKSTEPDKTTQAQPPKPVETRVPEKVVETPKPAPEPAPATPPPPKPEPVQAKPEPPPPPKPEPKPKTPAPSMEQTDMSMGLPANEEKVKEGDIVPLGPEVRPPQLVKEVKPRIPLAASRMNLKGRLVCRILISHTGAVERVQVISADPPRIRETFSSAAEDALSQWRYSPAEKNGVKVKVWKTVTLAF